MTPIDSGANEGLYLLEMPRCLAEMTPIESGANEGLYLLAPAVSRLLQARREAACSRRDAQASLIDQSRGCRKEEIESTMARGKGVAEGAVTHLGALSGRVVERQRRQRCTVLDAMQRCQDDFSLKLLMSGEPIHTLVRVNGLVIDPGPQDLRITYRLGVYVR
jgi:hypothetical protein